MPTGIAGALVCGGGGSQTGLTSCNASLSYERCSRLLLGIRTITLLAASSAVFKAGAACFCIGSP